MATRHAVTVLSVLPVVFAAGHPALAAAAENPVDAAPVPVTAPSDPHALNLGATTVELPDWVDPVQRDQAQAAVDGAMVQISAAYDGIGVPRDDATRRTASTIIGGGLGGLAGAAIGGSFALEGCAKGIAAGAVIGAIVGGAPTVGVASVLGGVAGGAIGCVVGGAIEGVGAGVLGAGIGAGIGATVGGAMGAGTEQQVAPPQQVTLPQQLTPVEQPVAAVADATVTSLRSAIKSMPPADPATLGALATPVNDFLSTLQAAI